MTSVPYRLLGQPQQEGLLIIGDHASNKLPDEIDLGIDRALLDEHVAWDIGVAAVSELIVVKSGCAAFLGNISRLVVDFNRYADEVGVIPHHSDGITIAANRLSEAERIHRLASYYHPYHDRLQQLLTERRPSLILSLHSFTPLLLSRPEEQRPWEIGVLYNDDEIASKLGLGYLEAHGVVVGDQIALFGEAVERDDEPTC